MHTQDNNIHYIHKTIGKAIYELRLASGMSRQELGEKIGVTHQQCQKYEKGTNRISACRLSIIAKVLNQPIQHFFEMIKFNTPDDKVSTHHQRMCLEVSRNFMKISSPIHQEAVNNLIKILAK